MILRKPYGFLIKYFKHIHLILCAIYIYLAIKTNSIYQYYNAFISGSESKLNAIKYVNNYYLIGIVASIIISLVVYTLMKYKKKPRLLYLILIGLYIVVGTIISVSYEGLYTIYISVLSTKTLRLYRDILQMILWVQYVPIVFVLIRGLGFDIKKFNFVSDAQELGLDIGDSEEVELTINNTENTKRKLHRGVREFKYYYLENKVFIHIIIAIIIVIGISTYTIDREFINKKYQENELVVSNNFSIKVLNTYVTSKNYLGNTVGNMNENFVIVVLNIQSNLGKQKFNSANLILNVNDNSYSSKVRYGGSFTDIGVVYQNQLISGNNTYLFLYPVLKTDIDKEIELVYAEEKVISLSPSYLDKDITTKEIKMGEVFDLSTTIMKSGSFKVSSYELGKSFDYLYNYVILDKEYTSNMVISNNDNAIIHLVIDSNLNNLSNFEFLSNYAKLKYKVEDSEYTSSVFLNQTPNNYNDGLYIAVDSNLMDASDIWLEITIRDKKIIYVLR